jgi:hypothetical protein
MADAGKGLGAITAVSGEYAPCLGERARLAGGGLWLRQPSGPPVGHANWGRAGDAGDGHMGWRRDRHECVPHLDVGGKWGRCRDRGLFLRVAGLAAVGRQQGAGNDEPAKDKPCQPFHRVSSQSQTRAKRLEMRLAAE